MAEALLEIFPDHLREELAFNQNRYIPKTSNNIFRDVHNNEVARKRQLVKEAKAKEKDTGSPYSDQNKQLSKQTLKSIEGNKRFWKSDVWEGNILGARSSREWQF